jgi:SulP family sulfate permease
MDIIFVEGSIFFGSATYVLDNLQRRLRNHPYTANLLIRMHKVNTLDASGIHILEILRSEIRQRGGGLFFAGLNHRVFEVFKNSGFLKEIGEPHIRSTTCMAIRGAMQETFCPAVCAACEFSVFQECPELKKGNWEIFGEGVQPRVCVLPQFLREEQEAGGPKAGGSAGKEE